MCSWLGRKILQRMESVGQNNKWKPFIDTGTVGASVLKCNIFQPKKPQVCISGV